jgi:hypothetical protein
MEITGTMEITGKTEITGTTKTPLFRPFR